MVTPGWRIFRVAQVLVEGVAAGKRAIAVAAAKFSGMRAALVVLLGSLVAGGDAVAVAAVATARCALVLAQLRRVDEAGIAARTGRVVDCGGVLGEAGRRSEGTVADGTDAVIRGALVLHGGRRGWEGQVADVAGNHVGEAGKPSSVIFFCSRKRWVTGA